MHTTRYTDGDTKDKEIISFVTFDKDSGISVRSSTGMLKKRRQKRKQDISGSSSSGN
eukprot:CAMPEP_0194078538 /NCGR_PEP_ID=MMETSP0149-20130528/4900_1 /TAXON_ID=122233 /ORGANISM="Chaetoceros debilis, Strain MM31A-1" /LENGTH=56 /DNA_ID=CAMNT_0038759817 /DNA_START=364 /DNA_END=534 /DNA_ORIENTATION=+